MNTHRSLRPLSNPSILDCHIGLRILIDELGDGANHELEPYTGSGRIGQSKGTFIMIRRPLKEKNKRRLPGSLISIFYQILMSVWVLVGVRHGAPEGRAVPRP